MYQMAVGKPIKSYFESNGASLEEKLSYLKDITLGIDPNYLKSTLEPLGYTLNFQDFVASIMVSDPKLRLGYKRSYDEIFSH